VVTRVDGDLVGVVKLLVLDFVKGVLVVDGDLVGVENLLVVSLVGEVVAVETVVVYGLFEVVKVRVLGLLDVVVWVLTRVAGVDVVVAEVSHDGIGTLGDVVVSVDEEINHGVGDSVVESGDVVVTVGSSVVVSVLPSMPVGVGKLYKGGSDVSGNSSTIFSGVSGKLSARPFTSTGDSATP
jgi:hypothetical protein